MLNPRTPLILVLLTIAAAPGAVTGDNAVRFPYGVGSGEVTPGSVVLWTRADRAAVLNVDISKDSRFTARITRTAAARTS